MIDMRGVRVLLTGITGFVGSHMADFLLAQEPDLQIFATRRWRSRDENIKHLYGNDRVKFYECDLLDRGSLRSIIEIAQPTLVFHFAAQSFPETSFATPVHTLNTNVIGTVNLLEELKFARQESNLKVDPLIVSVSSSEVYGNPSPDEIPITERNAIRAANPYSVSKCAHDLMSQYYHKAYGMRVITTRLFSHEGARRGKQFALSSFAYQIAKHELQFEDVGFRPDDKYVINVGNLNSIRTYAHIDDAIKAYWACVTHGQPGEVYNIGGDYTCTVGEALEKLLEYSCIPRSMFDIVVDPARIRATDITLQKPDSSKFKHATGWQVQKTMDDIVVDLLNYWRTRLDNEHGA